MACKLVKCLFLLIVSSAVAQQIQQTPNYHFNLPPYQYPRYDQPINANFNSLDALLFQGLINQYSSDPPICTGQIWFNTISQVYKACIGGVPAPLVGSSPQPILFPSSATPSSYGNECQNLPTGTDTLSAIPMIQEVDGSNVAHDVMCYTSANQIVFPPAGMNAGLGIPSGISGFEIANSLTASRNGLTMTNLSSSSRGNRILWRSCVGGCGTDFNLFEDFRQNGDEDIAWQQGTGSYNLYFTGNCPAGCPIGFGPSNATIGIKQFFISDSYFDAKTNPEFGLVKGHIAHGAGSGQADNWGTLALSSGVGSYNFDHDWVNAPLCSCNNPNQAGSPIACSASATAHSLSIKSGSGSDTVSYSCQGNPY